MMHRSIAVFVEDATDADVLRVLLERLGGPGHQLKPYSGKGCSRLRGKLARNMEDAARRGCREAIVLHDLDRRPGGTALNDERSLRTELEGVPVPAGLTRTVCIPVEELEAWFWSDDAVVKRVGRGKGRASANPEGVSRPKEALATLSRGPGGKATYDTNRNDELARVLDTDVCYLRCPSFRELHDFLKKPARPRGTRKTSAAR